MSNNFKKLSYGLLISGILSLISGCASLDKNGTSAKKEFRNSVVRISTTIQQPFYYNPWIWHQPQRRSGQGVVVGKDLVLTLASVVKNSKLIEITMGSEPLPTPMEVVVMDLNSNIALLRGNYRKMQNRSRFLKNPNS